MTQQNVHEQGESRTAQEGMSVRCWPEGERPREKILRQGAESLTDAELLAILLRNGTRGCDAVRLARDLLSVRGGLRGLFSSSSVELGKILGLGPAKIAALLAVPELSIRRLREEVLGKSVVRDPESVIQFLYASMRDLNREAFKVLFLDKGHRILSEESLFRGTVDQTVVHIREIIKEALDRHASAIMLVHNHPSGRTEPSMEDRAMTGKIQGACLSVGIRLLDHIIIGDNQYFSFREHQLL